VLSGEYSYPIGLSKPVVAAVNGVAAGLGLSYMLFYDMRIASERARFATIFAHRGLVAEHGSAWLLPRLIGTANACDLLFSGRMIDAQEALRIGLVNRVVPHGSLMRVVRATVQELVARCSPRSLRIMKRQIYGGNFTDLETAVDLADREMVASFATEDFREGVASFVERRPPRFTGR
jgi:enoyl-CoA hydratase/carnithine racemase